MHSSFLLIHASGDASLWVSAGSDGSRAKRQSPFVSAAALVEDFVAVQSIKLRLVGQWRPNS
jgi:hypothetical protein